MEEILWRIWGTGQRKRENNEESLSSDDDDTEVMIEEPSYNKMENAIIQLKNKRAVGTDKISKRIKEGGDELHKHIFKMMMQYDK